MHKRRYERKRNLWKLMISYKKLHPERKGDENKNRRKKGRKRNERGNRRKEETVYTERATTDIRNKK